METGYIELGSCRAVTTVDVNKKHRMTGLEPPGNGLDGFIMIDTISISSGIMVCEQIKRFLTNMCHSTRSSTDKANPSHALHWMEGLAT